MGVKLPQIFDIGVISMAKKMKVEIIESKTASKEYGKIAKIIFPDKSKIYIHKKGWSLVSPNKKGNELTKVLNRVKKEKNVELLLPYGELNIAIQQTIKMGYVVRK